MSAFKYLLSVLLCIATFTEASSQGWEIFKSGLKWTYIYKEVKCSQWADPCTYNCINVDETTGYHLSGDTIINDTLFYKRYTWGNSKSTDCYTGVGPSYNHASCKYILLRYDTTAKCIVDTKNKIIFNFNLQLNDTIGFPTRMENIGPVIKCIVRKIDTIEVLNIKTKRFYVQVYSSQGSGIGACRDSSYIIDGIGHNRGSTFFDCWNDGFHLPIIQSNLYYSIDTAAYNCLNYQTSIDDVEDEQFQVYPNPVVYNMLFIRAVELQTTTHYDVYTLSGTKLLSGNLINSNSINVEKLPKGIYILRLSEDSLNGSNIRFVKL